MTRESSSLDMSFNVVVDPLAATKSVSPTTGIPTDVQIMHLLRDLVHGQQRQNELLERMMEQTVAAQQARASELHAWRSANPELARACRQTMDALARAQVAILQELTEELSDSGDAIESSPYLLGEFIDRFGPRMAHLNCVLQMVGQLGETSDSSDPDSDQ